MRLGNLPSPRLGQRYCREEHIVVPQTDYSTEYFSVADTACFRNFGFAISWHPRGVAKYGGIAMATIPVYIWLVLGDGAEIDFPRFSHVHCNLSSSSRVLVKNKEVMISFES